MAKHVRPTLLMLCAHEPTDDPRVEWAAKSALRYYDVCLVGLHNWNSRRSDKETLTSSLTVYRGVKRPHKLQHALRSIHRDLWKHKLPKGSRPIFYVLVLVTLPLWLPLLFLAGLAESVFRAIYYIVRPLHYVYPRRVMTVVVRSLKHITAAALQRLGLTRFLEALKHLNSAHDTLTAISADVCPEPAVIYCHDMDSLSSGIAIKRKTGARLIYDSHEYWPYSDVEASWYQSRVFSMLEKQLIASADAVCTISDGLAERMERVYGYAPIGVVPNAEPRRVSIIPKADNSLIKEIAQGRVSFLFQGNFAPQRGLEELLTGWKAVDSATAVLFLRGRDNHSKQSLMKLAKQLKLEHVSVYFLDPVEVTDLVAAAGEADIGVIPYTTQHPAYTFACPNKLSQYMQANLAILSNNIAYVAKHLEAARCGYIYEASRPHSISAAVSSITMNRTKLENMKSCAYNYAQSVFNWEEQSRFLDEFLTVASCPLRERIVTD